MLPQTTTALSRGYAHRNQEPRLAVLASDLGGLADKDKAWHAPHPLCQAQHTPSRQPEAPARSLTCSHTYKKEAFSVLSSRIKFLYPFTANKSSWERRGRRGVKGLVNAAGRGVEVPAQHAAPSPAQIPDNAGNRLLGAPVSFSQRGLRCRSVMVSPH